MLGSICSLSLKDCSAHRLRKIIDNGCFWESDFQGMLEEKKRRSNELGIEHWTKESASLKDGLRGSTDTGK